jgi:serine/threonine protein kinase
LNSAQREIDLMKTLHHPNLVRLFEVIDDTSSSSIFLVMEFMNQGDLQNLTEKRAKENRMHEANAAFIEGLLQQIHSGLSFLHKHKVVHGDIKPHNVMIKNGVFKLGDFGMSVIVEDALQSGAIGE